MLARGSSASSLASGVHSDPQERQDPLKLAAEHELVDAEDSQVGGISLIVLATHRFASCDVGHVHQTLL